MDKDILGCMCRQALFCFPFDWAALKSYGENLTRKQFSLHIQPSSVLLHAHRQFGKSLAPSDAPYRKLKNEVKYV